MPSLIDRIAGESKTVFYRSRFEVEPVDSSSEIWPQIIRTLQNWLEDKEEALERAGKSSLLDEITADVTKYSDFFEVTNRDCYLSQRIAKGNFCHATENSRLTTTAFVGVGSEYVPQYWAMEYIEQDSSNWYRRWCTEVGVTAAGEGAYVVNVKVTLADDPAYLVATPWIPPRNTPRFIGDMLDLQNCRTVSAGIPLLSEPINLTEDNFDRFIERLVKPERRIPILAIAKPRDGDDAGDYLVDPYKLAKKIRGSAIVYMIDKSSFALRKKLFETFVKGKPSYKYGIANGSMRVFFPGVNLDDEEGSQRHHFYTELKLSRSNVSVISNDVCGAITRMYRRRSNEAVDLSSVKVQEERSHREALSQRVKTLERKTEKSEKPAFDINGLHTEQELKEYIALLEEDNANLFEAEKAHREYIELLEADFLCGDDPSVHDDEIQNLKAEIDQINGSLRAKEYRINELSDDKRLLEQQCDAYRCQAMVLQELTEFPSDAIGSLRLAEQAFGARLVFLPEAVSSAEDFRSGRASDVFNVLRTMAQDLWPLYFEESEAKGSVEDRYQSKSGYELSFRESSMTNKDSDLRKKRLRMYNGAEIDVSPHVKGKCGNRNEKFRVHFYVDRANQKLVIGHCGAHLETAGTRKVQ
ncbi:hypothetical protein [Adlercreutzia caecimuris]|uniref:Uncharacterized protein n=1 Tax=Adlercreutzia caecimuris TaxID=671266 RepID=A0A4S4FVP4_9ACTN|nr:hypothetical protein [Adlercreutzia caecimuris]THG34833.1 hypothetical protein E5986_10965 [Adlercreutzia caecimuris]